MPEGHAIHRLAAMLNELFHGEALEVSSPQGRFAAGASFLDGRVLVAGRAHGKQLFLGFGPRGAATAIPAARAAAKCPVEGEPADSPTLEVQAWLRVHLGLYGAWTFAGDSTVAVVHAIGAPRRRVGETETALTGVPAGGPRGTPSGEPPAGAWRAPAPRGAVRVRLLGAHAVADLTGPSACEVLTDPERSAAEQRLGPDPLIPGADVEAFVTATRRSRVAVGQLLMDQSVVAGVGNIYRAEVLFRAGLDPLTPGREVPAETLRAIWADLVVLMADGVRRGRIVTTGDEAEPHWVYHRDGLACRACGSPILVKELAGRNLFWCAVCQ